MKVNSFNNIFYLFTYYCSVYWCARYTCHCCCWWMYGMVMLVGRNSCLHQLIFLSLNIYRNIKGKAYYICC